MNNNYYDKAVPIPLTFYAYGQSNINSLYRDNSSNSLPLQQCPYSYRNANTDNASNVLERNLFSMNTKEFHNKTLSYAKSQKTIDDVDKYHNNYLNPLYNYIPHSSSTAKMTTMYGLDKEKKFTKEAKHLDERTIHGSEVSKDSFNQMKRSISACSVIPNQSYRKLHSNFLYFKPDKQQEKNTINEMHNDLYSISINSKGVPNWMKTSTLKKAKENKEKISQMGKTIAVFSRFKKWINVDPNEKSRRKSLESFGTDMEKMQKIKPMWMTSTHWNKDYKDKGTNRGKDIFRATAYRIPKQKNAKVMCLIDKDNSHKSIFTKDDYRHNVMFEEKNKKYSQGIPLKPKKFFI